MAVVGRSGYRPPTRWPAARTGRRARGRPAAAVAWLGRVPFFAYVGIFLLLPTVIVVVGAFANARRRRRPWRTSTCCGRTTSSQSFVNSVELSAVSAVIGAVVGARPRLRHRDRRTRTACCAGRRPPRAGCWPSSAASRWRSPSSPRSARPGWSPSSCATTGVDIYANGVWLYDLKGLIARLHLLPDPADGAGVPARAGRHAAAVAGGDREPRRHDVALLAARGGPAARPGVPRRARCCCSPTRSPPTPRRPP